MTTLIESRDHATAAGEALEAAIEHPRLTPTDAVGMAQAFALLAIWQELKRANDGREAA